MSNAQGLFHAVGGGHPMGEGEKPAAVAGLAVVVRRRKLRRAGPVAAGGGHARRGPRHHRPTRNGAGAIGARLSYLSALVAFQQGRIAEGNAALTAAMGYMQHGSLWLFHIGLADEMYVGGRATPRVAMDLFGECFAIRSRPIGPSIRWSRWPRCLTPHPVPLEHWFERGLGSERHAGGHRDRRAGPATPLLQFAGVWRPVGVVAVDSRGTDVATSAAGRSPAARPAGPLSGLRETFATGASDSRERWPNSRWWPRIRRL